MEQEDTAWETQMQQQQWEQESGSGGRDVASNKIAARGRGGVGGLERKEGPVGQGATASTQDTSDEAIRKNVADSIKAKVVGLKEIATQIAVIQETFGITDKGTKLHMMFQRHPAIGNRTKGALRGSLRCKSREPNGPS